MSFYIIFFDSLLRFQVFFYPADGRGDLCAVARDLELSPEFRMVLPGPFHDQDLPWCRADKISHHSHRLVISGYRQLRNRVTRLFVEIGHPLDLPLKLTLRIFIDKRILVVVWVRHGPVNASLPC